MTAFTRSSSALYSIHRFFGVDVVVYCEGGPSLSYNDAVKQEVACGTLDTLYWSSVVSSFSINKKFHFKSVGGKVTINAISEEVEKLSLGNITVCRDSDYDRALGRAVSGGRIAWTMGYSWENDVVRPAVLESIAINLVGSGDDGISIIKDIRKKTSEFERDLQRWTEIDISLCSRGREGIFDRDKPLSAIDMESPPNLRKEGLAGRLISAGYQRKPKKVLSVATSDVTISCFGKLISRALYHTLMKSLKKVANIRLDYDLFMRMAISESMKLVVSGNLPIFAHHIHAQKSAFS